jgi:hypothetical protein
MPLIPVKQCKQIEPGLRQVLDPSHYLHNEIFLDRSEVKIVDVHHDYVKSLLYPGWNTNLFQAKKQNSIFFSEQTKWVLNDSNTRVMDFYQGQISDLLHGIDPCLIVYDNQNKPSKLKEIPSAFNTI